METGIERQNPAPSRQWLYALCAAGVQTLVYATLLGLMTWAVIHQAARPELTDPYGEQSLTEWLQVVFLGIGIALLAWKAVKSSEPRPLEILFAGLFAAAFIREFDWAFELYLPKINWSIAVLIAMAVTAMLVYRRRSSLARQVEEFLRHPGYGIMLCGFLTVFVFSRIFGHNQFWINVLGIHYVRVAKAVAEENTELLGYFLLMVSVIEWVRPRRGSAPDQP